MSSEMNENKFKPVPGIAGRYISTIEDENGLLKEIQYHDTDTFNFGFERAIIASAIHLLPLYELIIAYELFKLRIGNKVILFSVFFHATRLARSGADGELQVVSL